MHILCESWYICNQPWIFVVIAFPMPNSITHTVNTIRVKSNLDCYIVQQTSLQWCHNGHDGISNHQPHHCLLNFLFRRKSKETSKLRITGLCAGNSPVTGELPTQRASNGENFSIWWCHNKSDLDCYIAQQTWCMWGVLPSNYWGSQTIIIFPYWIHLKASEASVCVWIYLKYSWI